MKHELLQLNATANWGSTGRIAEGIGAAAIHRGWHSTIAYGRYSNHSSSKLIKVGTKYGVYSHYLRNRVLDGEGLGSRYATRKLIKQISELQPDIIHLHNIHDHWLNYPLLFEYLATIVTPIVWTFHDCWAFTGHCYHFERNDCKRWQTNCSNCPQKASPFFDKSLCNFNLKKNLLQSLQRRLTIVCVSEWLAEYVQKSFLSNCRIEVINNGIDIGIFTIDSSKKQARNIIGVSNVWPDYKGLSDFVQLRSLLNEDIGITLVGLTDEQIATLPKGITGISRTENVAELVELYQASSVFVNPTRNDSFPTVNLEALACGIPVITYRTGGSPESVDFNTGIVIDKGDVSGLAQAINTVLDHAEKYTPENCRKRVVEKFNKNVQFNKYIDLYELLIS